MKTRPAMEEMGSRDNDLPSNSLSKPNATPSNSVNPANNINDRPMMQSSIAEPARAELASLPFDILHMIV